MMRESELIGEIVRDPSWKRIDRLLAESAGVDTRAVAVFLLGLGTIVFALVAAQ